MNIGKAARAAGMNAKMVRYYESIGVLPKAGRTASGYRVYSPHDINTLRFAAQARALGFSLESVKELLKLWQDRNRPSAKVKAVALRHVAALRQRIREMEQIAGTLEHLAEHCHGDNRPHCPILDAIEKPAAAMSA